MLKPIAAIRRKASSFREQRRTPSTPKVTAKSKAQKRPPSIELDNYFSIDTFLRRLKPSNYRKQQTPHLPVSISSSTSDCELDELPEKCLKQIFSNLPSLDLQNLRLTCSRFDSIIVDSKLIPRNSIPCLQLHGNNNAQIYRFSHKYEPIYDRHGYPEAQVDKGLKFCMANKVVLDNIFFNAEVSKSFLYGIDYHLAEIVFDFCHFSISAFAFSQLIQMWKPKRIELINCDWREAENTALISDTVFIENSELDEFVFSTTGSKKILITDKIFHHFSQTCSLPSTIKLYGCETKITLNGIKAAVTAYFLACKNAIQNGSKMCSSKPFKWHLGNFYSNSSEILTILRPFLSQSKVFKTEFPNFEIRFRPTKSFPVLCLSMVFLQRQAIDFSDDETESDISWDDTDVEEN